MSWLMNWSRDTRPREKLPTINAKSRHFGWWFSVPQGQPRQTERNRNRYNKTRRTLPFRYWTPAQWAARGN